MRSAGASQNLSHKLKLEAKLQAEPQDKLCRTKPRQAQPGKPQVKRKNPGENGTLKSTRDEMGGPPNSGSRVWPPRVHQTQGLACGHPGSTKLRASWGCINMGAGTMQKRIGTDWSPFCVVPVAQKNCHQWKSPKGFIAQADVSHGTYCTNR